MTDEHTHDDATGDGDFCPDCGHPHNKEEQFPMIATFRKAHDWIRENDVDDDADEIAPFFPDALPTWTRSVVQGNMVDYLNKCAEMGMPWQLAVENFAVLVGDIALLVGVLSSDDFRNYVDCELPQIAATDEDVQNLREEDRKQMEERAKNRDPVHVSEALKEFLTGTLGIDPETVEKLEVMEFSEQATRELILDEMESASQDETRTRGGGEPGTGLFL